MDHLQFSCRIQPAMQVEYVKYCISILNYQRVYTQHYRCERMSPAANNKESKGLPYLPCPGDSLFSGLR